MKNKLIIFVVSIVLININLKAQDFRFSQFDLNPLYINPAYSGSSSDLRVGFNYRNQWFNVPGQTLPGPLSSYNLAVDKRFGNILIGGLGLNLFQSYKGEGLYKHTHAGLNYSWHLPLRTDKFNFYMGVGLSYNSLGIDFSKLVFTDQISVKEGYLMTPSSFVPQSSGVRHYLDMISGLVIKGNLSRDVSGEFSFSVNHLNKPNVSLNRQDEGLARKYTAFGSMSFKLKRNKLYLNPKFIMETQGHFNTFTFGTNLYIVHRYHYATREHFSKPFYVGAYFQSTEFVLQTTNSIILSAGHTDRFGKSNTRYQIGASIDVNLGGLNLRSNVTGEISMNIIFDTENNLKRRSKRQGKCTMFKGNPLSPL